MIYVIVRLEVENSIINISGMYNSQSEAIESLHRMGQNVKDNKDNCDVLIVKEKRLEVIERNPTWFTSGKIMKTIFQILEFQGYYNEDYKLNNLPINLQEENDD